VADSEPELKRTPEVKDMLYVFASINDIDAMSSLMQDLFTVREIKDISQRLTVARKLDSGESYARVEDDTGASATTISRVSKCLNYGAGGYRIALDMLNRSASNEKSGVSGK